jgi:hypothetical protein
MGPLVVVVVHPGIQRRLGLLDAGKDLAIEELGSQGLVPTLHLAVVVGERGLDRM